MKNLISLCLILSLFGCDSGSSKSPEKIQAEVEKSQKKFAEERARIERERKTQEENLAMQRSFIAVRFVSVTEKLLEVELTNETDKNLDNISGSLEVFDEKGNYVTGIGLTLWVPGDVYLPSRGTQIVTKSLDMERPGNKDTLLSSAAQLTYYFTMSRYQFVGEAEVKLVQPINQGSTTPQPEKMIEPVKPKEAQEQVTPEPCGAEEFEIITETEYYAGPKCEHVSRNLDSERYKVSYIGMCRQNDDNHTAPTPVASVQIASCKKDLNRRGINYSKQLCCHDWARSANGRQGN